MISDEQIRELEKARTDEEIAAQAWIVLSAHHFPALIARLKSAEQIAKDADEKFRRYQMDCDECAEPNDIRAWREKFRAHFAAVEGK